MKRRGGTRRPQSKTRREYKREAHENTQTLVRLSKTGKVILCGEWACPLKTRRRQQPRYKKLTCVAIRRKCVIDQFRGKKPRVSRARRHSKEAIRNRRRTTKGGLSVALRKGNFEGEVQTPGKKKTRENNLPIKKSPGNCLEGASSGKKTGTWARAFERHGLEKKTAVKEIDPRGTAQLTGRSICDAGGEPAASKHALTKQHGAGQKKNRVLKAYDAQD